MSTSTITARPLTFVATQEKAVESSGALYGWVFPLLGVLSLAGSCILSSLRPRQVVDEVYTHVEVGDPSFFHLLRTVPHLGGGGMPLFYMTAWPWARVFGFSDLSLRLYSSAAICLSFLLLVAILRRRFTAGAAFLGVAFGFFSSLMVYDENGQGRAYGLYLLLGVAAIAQWLRVAELPRPRPRDLALLALSQAGLVLGHVLGLIYAGLLLAALLVFDFVQRRRFRPVVYLSLVAGWLALIPWIPAILASMAAGRPRGWIPMPTFAGLLEGLSCWVFTGLYWPELKHAPAALGLAWAGSLGCVAALTIAGLRALRMPRGRAVLMLGLALTLAPALFFVISRLAQPIFVPRYMILTAAGVAILCAWWAEQSRITAGVAGRVLSVVFLLLPVGMTLARKDHPIDIAAIERTAAGRPVVCDWAQDFLIVTRYSSDSAMAQYPLDWEGALHGPANAATDYHLMQNYRQQGYLAANLPDVAEVVSRPSFLLLDNADTNWFRLRIENNPRFTWKVLAQLDPEHRILEVEQKP